MTINDIGPANPGAWAAAVDVVPPQACVRRRALPAQNGNPFYIQDVAFGKM